MIEDRIILLENLTGEPWLILENNDRVLLNEYNSDIEHFYSPKVQDFKNYTELLGNITVPYMMFNNTFESTQLNTLHYDIETVDFLNKKGLHIFLTENLMKYDSSRVYHSRRTKKNFLHLNKDKGINEGIFTNPRCGQLDSIQDLINNNNLTNVTVYTPERGVLTAFTRYECMKFEWKDLYLQQFIKQNINNTDTVNGKIQYTFINSNWRYEPYRHVIASYLKNFNSKISWAYQSTEETFKKSIWFEPNDKLLLGFNKLNKSVPLNIDINVKESTTLKGNILDRFKLPKFDNVPNMSTTMYSDTFCSIVTESSFLDITTYISDKTLSAIFNQMPFIIVGPPYALKTAKDMGFKTFSKYWDESYDNELNHTKRMHKIFKLIDELSEYTISELTSMQEDMQSILIYNKEHIKDLEL
jgi:hypothetical protein